MKLTFVRALLFSSVFVAAGCSSDEDDDPIKDGRCTVDNNCPDIEYCKLDTGVCTAIPADDCADDNGCVAGETCAVPNACAPRDMCRNICVPKACTGPGECGTRVCVAGRCADPPACDNNMCPTGLECDAATMLCIEPGNTTCSIDTDCPTAGDICVGSMCGPPVSCTYSADCPTDQRCIQNVCRDPCTDVAECAPDPMFWTCDVSGECIQQCLADTNCPSGFICEGQTCIPAECTMDSDCGAMERCEGEEGGRGRCMEVVPCDPTDPNACMMNFECLGGECVELPTCRGDRDCPAARYCEDRHCQLAEACNPGNCPTDFDCIGDRCVPAVCRGDASCPTGEVCVAGECVAPNDGSTVTGVEILTVGGVVSTGTTLRFRAVATNAAGNIVPGVTFEWMSGTVGVATIDATGVATGGAQAGSTDIVASVSAGVMTVSSQPVTLVNLIASPEHQVVVVSEGAGAPIANATVVCNGVTQTTNTDGLATFAGLTAPYDCSVFDSGHDYVTVFGLTADATIRLPVKSSLNLSTGMTGMVDFSGISGADPVEISFSGASFAAPLSALTPLGLFGGNLFTFDLPVVGAIQLPSGTTAAAEVMGFPFSIKESFQAETKAGRRTAWSFGGLAGLTDLGIGGGGNLLTNLLPLLQTFSHGSTGQVTALTPLPTIVDTNDVDGDGDTTEMVPDYASFAPASLTPATRQRLRYQVTGDAATLPGSATAVLLISGVIVPRLGFVPLGLDGLEVTANVGSFSTSLAPPHDGLEVGSFAVIAAATDISQGGLASVMSAQMVVLNELPTEVVLDGGWLEFPTATFDDGARLMTVTGTGDVWRARLSSITGTWVVVAPVASGPITLPAPPAGMDDHSASSSVFVEDLDLGGQSPSAIFGVGQDDTAQDRTIVRFSQQAVR